MIRENDEIAADILSQFDSQEKPLISYTWIDFYKLAGAARLHRTRLDAIAEFARDEHEIIIGYGNNAVIVCVDKIQNRFRP